MVKYQAIAMELVCEFCRRGMSVDDIKSICQVAAGDILNLIAIKAQISKKEAKKVMFLKEAGLSLEDVSSLCDIQCYAIEFLYPRTPSVEIKVKDEDVSNQPSVNLKPLKSTRVIPKYIFSYTNDTDRLFRTSLDDGSDTQIRLRIFELEKGCSLCEMTGGRLLVTGGRNTKAAVSIDTYRDSAVVVRALMLNVKSSHTSIFHANFVYVFGGRIMPEEYEPKPSRRRWNDRLIKNCERYDYEQDKWESLAPLPEGFWGISAIVLEKTQQIFALGGAVKYQFYTNLIQQFSLVTLSWNVMTIQLPHEDYYIACFKVDESQIYFISNLELYRFTFNPNKITSVMSIENVDETYSRMPCYYSKGILYCSSGSQRARQMRLGRLSN